MEQDLLAELHRRGIRLRLTDDRLDVLAPTGSLTPDLRDRLRLERADLIAMLRRTALPMGRGRSRHSRGSALSRSRSPPFSTPTGSDGSPASSSAGSSRTSTSSLRAPDSTPGG